MKVKERRELIFKGGVLFSGEYGTIIRDYIVYNYVALIWGLIQAG